MVDDYLAILCELCDASGSDTRLLACSRVSRLNESFRTAITTVNVQFSALSNYLDSVVNPPVFLITRPTLDAQAPGKACWG